MMSVLSTRIILAASLTTMALPAQAEDRSELRACQAMVDRAAQAVATRPDDAELQRCRQIVREWMLRDARRSVDEQGRPLR